MSLRSSKRGGDQPTVPVPARPLTEAEQRMVRAQQFIAAQRAAAEAPRKRRRRSAHITQAIVGLIVVGGVAATAMIATRGEPESSVMADLPQFDETLPDPPSYWTTFRGPSWVSPSPWFQSQRSPGSDSVVVERDTDGPGAARPITLLVRREGSWYFDRATGGTKRSASADAATWLSLDAATDLRTMSEVVGGRVGDYLVLVDDYAAEGPGRRGAHDLHTYEFEFSRSAFCELDTYACDGWFRSFGMSTEALTVPLVPEASGISGGHGIRSDSGAPLPGSRRPAIDTDDTVPPETADSLPILRVTVDDVGLVWDVDLHHGERRYFSISLDELSVDPFIPPMPTT